MIRVVMAFQPGHPSRERPARLVLDMFVSLGWPVTISGGHPGVPFNAGHAKNNGARLALADEKLLVLADADCVAPPAQLREAVWLAREAPGVVWVADTIRLLNQATTEALAGWGEAAYGCAFSETRPTDSTPQLLAIRRDCFEEVGGYDEAYVGYGYEDYDFRARCYALWPGRTVAGTMAHLWHEPEREKVEGGPLIEANEARWKASA